MATPHGPRLTSCTNSTAECSASTACTQCARHSVHDSFHDQQAASGPHITPGDGAEVTLSERRTVTHGRARRTRRPGRQATIQSARLRLVLYRSGAGWQGPQYGTEMGIWEARGRRYLPDPALQRGPSGRMTPPRAWP